MQVYRLTITASHDFGNLVHESMHRTEDGAWAYSDHHALPRVQAAEGEEWRDCFECTVRAFELME